MSKSDFENSVRSVFLTLRELQLEKKNEDFSEKSLEVLKDENSKLKERNLCLEKKINDIQSRMDRMRVHCQAIVASSHGFKQFQDNLAKHIPRYMEEENAAMAEKVTQLELEVFRIGEEKQRCQEKMQQQQQKLDRLMELFGQAKQRVAYVEKQSVALSDTCKRFETAARALAVRCSALQRNQQHHRCLQQQADSRLADEKKRAALIETKLAISDGRLRALQNESARFKALNSDQRNEISYYTKQINALENQILELRGKLSDAQELIRDQSELLSQKLRRQ